VCKRLPSRRLVCPGGQSVRPPGQVVRPEDRPACPEGQERDLWGGLSDPWGGLSDPRVGPSDPWGNLTDPRSGRPDPRVKSLTFGAGCLTRGSTRPLRRSTRLSHGSARYPSPFGARQSRSNRLRGGRSSGPRRGGLAGLASDRYTTDRVGSASGLAAGHSTASRQETAVLFPGEDCFATPVPNPPDG
jgi:hypothetical protein